MNRGSLIKGVALAAALSVALSASAQSEVEPTRERLQQELADLRARIAKLEAADAQQPSAQQQTTATKQQVMTDAQRRSTLGSPSSITAGFDKGFFIKSDDGAFTLRPGVQVQFRYIANQSEDADGDEHFDDGFELRRTWFRFDGNAFSPDFTYSFVFETARSGGTVSLLDGWTQYKFAPHWAVKLGQFKENWAHERDVTVANQLAVERSLLDAVLGGGQTDRVQGASLTYGGGKEDTLRTEFTIHDGDNGKNTSFQDTPTSHWGVGARGEFKVKGDWTSYRDFTAKGTTSDLLVFGAGADFTQAGDSDILRSTIDAQWGNTQRLGVYAALHGNFSDVDVIGSSTDWGALAQVAYLITKKVEVFGRYDILQFDNITASGHMFNEITLGANYYLGPDGAYLHRAKFTLDLVYLPDGAPSDQTGLGILASDEDEFVVRGQFQLQI